MRNAISGLVFSLLALRIKKVSCMVCAGWLSGKLRSLKCWVLFSMVPMALSSICWKPMLVNMFCIFSITRVMGCKLPRFLLGADRVMSWLLLF